MLVAALAAITSPAFSQVTLLFPYGVAAGDVTPTRAVLWTRPARPQRVALEVSPGPKFGPLAFTGSATALAANGAVARFVARGTHPRHTLLLPVQSGRRASGLPRAAGDHRRGIGCAGCQWPPSSARSLVRDLASRRDTCRCEMPMRFAVSGCVRSAKNR